MGMKYREQFQARVRAALDEYETYLGKENPTETFIDAVTEAASDWADARYTDGCRDQSEAMSW